MSKVDHIDMVPLPALISLEEIVSKNARLSRWSVVEVDSDFELAEGAKGVKENEEDGETEEEPSGVSDVLGHGGS